MKTDRRTGTEAKILHLLMPYQEPTPLLNLAAARLVKIWPEQKIKVKPKKTPLVGFDKNAHFYIYF